MSDDTQILRRAKDGLEATHAAFEEIIARLMELTAQLTSERVRRAEAEQRAADAVRSNEQLKDKAARTDSLERAAARLVDAIDRLPVRMEDAGTKQMVVPPEIALYGTHDWDAVIEAKYALLKATGRKENDDRDVRDPDRT